MSKDYAERLAAASPLAAAALQFRQVVDAADQARATAAAGPAVHRFDSTADAYAAADRQEVADGDVLVVESERVVAFVVVILAVAITEEHGALRPYANLGKPAREYGEGVYTRSVDLGEKIADELGFPLADPAAAAAAKNDPDRPTPIEIPRLLIEPGDILHAFGARLKVVDTGIRLNPTAQDAQWWADVEGVTKDGSRIAYRGRWTIGVPVATAAWDVVIVDRVLSAPSV
ncbi:hypothetical protein ACFQ6O_34495 [Streptomyces sp. NPDC056441]|uniref:hypothetical protein n=1 Tax=Streptomyces sp. NPDC056441 TaxID=3345817 RepID=UPI0036A0BE20